MSPLSVQTALGLALMGAAGETAVDLAKGLKLQPNANHTAVADAFEQLTEPFSRSTFVQLANKIYVHKTYHIKETFDTVATKLFHSETQAVDFAQSDSCAQIINKWVATQTNQQINTVIAKESLNKHTQLVLVNAIYFEGLWAHKFTSISRQPFFNTKRNSVDVDMMHLEVCVCVMDTMAL